jgi:hypothetical protein
LNQPPWPTEPLGDAGRQQAPAPPQYSADGRFYWDGRQWIPVSPAPPAGQATLVRKLEFDCEVGDAERHLIHFSFDQFWGNLSISVDGRRIIRDFRLFSLRTTKRYRFTVGEAERHDVVIEKSRKVLMAGFRQQTCAVFVDGRLVGEYTN